MKTLQPTKGHLLIAEPAILADASFNRAVILLAQHDRKSSIGFILNRPSEYTLSDLIEGTDSKMRIYEGGPVEQNNLYFIHKKPDLIADSIEICDGMYWGGHFEDVIRLVSNKEIDERDIQFFLGYSGWGPSQLNTELEEHVWIVTENEEHGDIIGHCCSSLWREYLVALGDDYALWANAPLNPSYN